MQTILVLLLFALLGFFSGSVMYANIIAKWRGVDISEHNPGATSVFRLAGKHFGVLCFFLDAAKGFLPVFFARMLLGMHHPLFALVIAAPVLGHCFSPMLRFRGGIGLATTIGVQLAVSVWYAPMFMYWLFFAGLFRYVIRIKPDGLQQGVVVMFLFALASLLIPHIPLPLRLGAAAVAAIVISKSLKHCIREKDQWAITFFWKKSEAA